MAPAILGSSACVLLVRDVVASANHYRDVLCFNYERFWGEPPAFVILSRDNVRVMLDQAPVDHVITPNWTINRNMWNLYCWVDDVDRLYAELRERGAKIDYHLENKPYDIREFGVQDLDGYDIGFGMPIVR